MGWAGAGAAAAQSLRNILEQRELKRIRDADLEMRRREQDARMADIEEGRTARKRSLQLQEAGSIAQQLDAVGPGVELSEQHIGALTGTPYEARIERRTSLPSRSIQAAGGANISDPGGQPVGTFLRPTQAQTRDAEERFMLNDTINRLSPEARNLARLEQAGVRGLNVHDVEGTTRHLAHVEADERRGELRANRVADHQNRLAVSRDVANAARADARDSRVTGKDRAGVLRDADAAASQYLKTLEGDAGILPDDIDPAAIQQQYRDAYLEALESGGSRPSGGATTKQRIDNLQRIIPGPTRTGRQPRLLSGPLQPIGTSRQNTGSGGDAYEQYLSRGR